MENLYEARKIRTVSGLYVDVFDPDPATIIIEDIAHALSMQCRFGGHLPRFYSVAEHSINCAKYVTDQTCRFEALMHDASEAYLLDIPKPIKNGLDNYKEIEDKLMAVIAAKFGFKWPLSGSTKAVDTQMLEWEWHTIMLGQGNNATAKPKCWPSNAARSYFLYNFKKLSN